MNIITLEKKNFVIKFDYNPALVQRVKTLNKYKWNPSKVEWTVAATRENKDKLLTWSDFTLSPDVVNFQVDEQRVEDAKYDEYLLRLQQLDLSHLFPYQKEGVEFILKTRKGILAGDVGTGKTVQALTAFSIFKDPIVIITKSVLKLNWKHEIAKWLKSDNIQILSGKTSTKLSNSVQYYIINYDILDSWASELSKFKHFIFDESQFVKNFKTKRTKAALDMVAGAETVFLLSATPIANKVKDLASQLELIDRLDSFGGKFQFLKYHCDGIKTPFGWKFEGASNLEELHEKLKIFQLRRKKEDVLKDLPPQQYFNVYLEIDNRKEYDAAHEEFKRWYASQLADEKAFLDSIEHLSNQKKAQAEWSRRQLLDKNSMSAEHLVRMEKLKQLAANGKLNSCIDWIDNFLESGEKLVVFCTHKDIQKKLIKAFPEAVSILAEDSAETRDRNVNLFQNTDTKLIICSIDAAGEGITLTAANNTAIIEFPWSPAKLIQLGGRTHRIGSVGNSVNYYFLIADKTIDNDIIALLNEKKIAADTAIDGTSNTSILNNLLDKLK